MALKNYKVGDYVYQFEEGTQPSDAVEVKPAERKEAAKPANKSRKANDK